MTCGCKFHMVSQRQTQENTDDTTTSDAHKRWQRYYPIRSRTADQDDRNHNTSLHTTTQLNSIAPAMTKEEPLTDPVDSQDYLSRQRAKLATQLQLTIADQTNCDIDQNIREIRAILATNDEIFQRVMPSITSYDSDGTSFVRYGYEVVQMRQIKASSTDSTLYKAQFITHPTRKHEWFNLGILSSLPIDVQDIVVAQYMAGSFSEYIHYEAVFQSALSLHEDVLSPFLAILKDHLMDVQVCLGGIDEWVAVPYNTINYVEEKFGTVKLLSIPTDADLEEVECKCEASVHANVDICLRCKKPFDTHMKRGDGHYECSGRKSSYDVSVFKCKPYHVLREYSVDGRFEATFEVSKESERAKLNKLLEFFDFVSNE